MKYAIIDENRILTEVREYEVTPPHKEGRLLPIVDDVLPTPSSTQKVVPGPIVIRELDALQTWELADKTAEELRKIWSPMVFLLRFTAEERALMRAAAKVDENAADFMLILQTADEIWSDHPFTVAGLQMLVQAGIITEARRLEILGD